MAGHLNRQLIVISIFIGFLSVAACVVVQTFVVSVQSVMTFYDILPILFTINLDLWDATVLVTIESC
jgi:hypothetical protein